MPSHLAAFKDCPAETGRGYGGPHVFNNAQSGNPGGFTTQDRCQELPTREIGVGEGDEESYGCRGARAHKVRPLFGTFPHGMCACMCTYMNASPLISACLRM